MRPALAALAEQQELIEQQQKVIAYLASRDKHREAQVSQLTRGLAAVARFTGTDTQVRTAIFKQADEQNPAQPVPSPASEPAANTTLETKTPEAFADVRAPGMVPGSNQDVAADAVSTAYTPGMDVPSPAINKLVDVNRPVEGTEGPRPLSEVKTLVDVRAGNPMQQQVAFPLGEDFAQSTRTSALEEEIGLRYVTAQRLAKARIASGTSESDDDLVVQASLVADEALTTEAMQNELAVLERVKTASVRKVQASTNTVPRAAGVQRTMPVMQATSARRSEDDELADLFLGSTETE